MHTNKRILAGLVLLIPPVFFLFLREGYELPKWFLWRWGMLFIFLGEIIRLTQNTTKKKKERTIKVFVPLFIYPWLAFFLFSILSLGGAVNLQLGLLTVANLVLGFGLLFFISVRWDEPEIKFLIPFLILPALPVAIYGIFQAFGSDFVRLVGPFRGAISTFGHRNFVAEYELMILPLLMYGGFFYAGPLTAPLPSGRKSASGEEKNQKIRLARVFSLISLPIVYTHFIMTHTRGSYVALIVALLFIAGFAAALPQQKVRRWFIGTTALLLLLTGIFLAHNYNIAGEKVISGKTEILRGIYPRAERRAQNDTEKTTPDNTEEIPNSLQSRIFIWQATLAVFRKHPVLGIGAGNLNEVIPPYYPEKLLQRLQGKLDAGTSHNEYLQNLAETGILGIVSFLAFLLLLLSFAGRVSWQAAKKRGEFLPLFLTAGILGILAASLVSAPLQRPATLFLFWLFTGFLVVFGREESRSFILDPKIQEKILFGFIVILGLSAYNFGWLPLRADFYGQKSFTAYRGGNREQAILDIEKALVFQPQNRHLLTLAGNTYLNTGRLKEAINSYRQFIVYHPYAPSGYGNLGLALAQSGLFADAEKYLKYSLQLDAYQPLVRNTLGTVYLQQGKRAEAKEEFLKAIAIDPESIFPRLNLQEMEKNILLP